MVWLEIFGKYDLPGSLDSACVSLQLVKNLDLSCLLISFRFWLDGVSIISSLIPI